MEQVSQSTRKSKKGKTTKKTAKKLKLRVIKQNIGVDIAKDDFKVCVQQLFENQQRKIKGSRTFNNTPSGWSAFLEWLHKKMEDGLEKRVTVEATGVYYESLVHFLDDHDIYVSVILPNKFKAFAKSLNIKSKTDKIDAQVLAQMGLERNLDRWRPCSSKMRELKQLTRDRVSILEEKIALGNKLHALKSSHQPHSRVIDRLKQRIKLIKEQIKEVEKQIKQVVQQDEFIKERMDNIIQPIKGIDVVTVATIIAETDGFNLFSSRAQLVSYVGYDVVQRQSGSSINGKTKISKKGNRFIRRALYFPAINVVRYMPESEFAQLFNRIVERTALSMKAYVAVQRKILLIIYTLFKNNVPYDPNFYKKHQENKISLTDATLGVVSVSEK